MFWVWFYVVVKFIELQHFTPFLALLINHPLCQYFSGVRAASASATAEFNSSVRDLGFISNTTHSCGCSCVPVNPVAGKKSE